MARHFWRSLFQPESTVGEDGFATYIGQMLAILITASWFLPVQLFRKYAELHGLSQPEPYRLAYASDTLSAMLLMSILVGVLTTIEWTALFPSRRDHLVLTPLPITRLQLFAAKLTALLLFVTLFIAAISLLTSFSLPMVASGRWEPRSVWLRSYAWLVASAGACYFVFLTLVAIQGVLLSILPRRWFESASFMVQVALLVSLLCGFPLFFYFPGQRWIAAQSPWLDRLPPAWFWAVSEKLTGRGGAQIDRMASRAWIALGLAALVAALSYLVSYLQHNRYSLESARVSRRPWIRWVRLASLPFRRAEARGTAEFIVQTLARGRQQKMVVWLILGLGLAMIFESSMYAASHMGDAPGAMVALPLTLSFFAMVGLRRAFRVAADLPANWLFEFTEAASSRRGQLEAAFSTLVLLGGLPALLAFSPFQDLRALPLQLLLVLALAEHLLTGWRSIPFTFAQNPARRHLIHSAIVHLLELSAYSFAGSALIVWSFAADARYWRLIFIFLAIWLALRYRRRREWGRAPLEFAEPVRPAVEPLRLS